MGGTVAVLLVSHDGSRWLPQVLDRLRRQTIAPDRVLAVDTGSTDGSAELLREALGPDAVEVTDRATAYPSAVRRGLELLGTTGAEDWVWLLHDDSAPAPDALERLLDARSSGADVLGPKLREWPSLRRLLEVGVTITGTAQRETGLERGEHDQGQHDEPRDVLAVNTAGMLIRGSVLADLGLSEDLPVVHTDLDLGWRVARAGLRTRTVPEAVVFHAEASRTGTRSPALTRARRRRVERVAALHTVLANCAPVALPFVAVRLLLGTLLRALGLLLVRAPGEAWAEVSAAATTLGRPARIARARRRAGATATVGSRAVRPLLASPWLPYRNGLDELTGIGAAVVSEAGARTGSGTSTGSGPSSWSDRLRHRPAFGLAALLTVLALVAGRHLLGAGRLSGGALPPAPGSALDWWQLYLATTHDVATGSTITAPAYVLPLAVLGSVLLGSASAAVAVLVLGSVPFAGVGGFRFLRVVTRSTPVSVWGAVAFAVLLATSGAVAQGRIGTLVAAAVLPWLATTAAGLFVGEGDRRRRAAWRTALWLAVAAAFAPVTWVLAAALAVLVAVVDVVRRRSAPLLVLVPPAAAAVLLLPWSALVWPDRSWAALFLDAGLPVPSLTGVLDAADVVGARAGDVGAAPAWIAGVTSVAALLALLRRGTRRRVLLCWLVALVGLVAVWLLAGAALEDPVGPGTVAAWTGVPLLLVHGSLLTASAVAGSGLRGRLGGRAFGWRQPAGVALGALALVLPVCGAGWWLWHGSDDPLGHARAVPVPAYLDAAAQRDRADGTLVLRGGTDDGVTVEVRRGGPTALGEEGVVPQAGDQDELLTAVGDLVTTPDPAATARLSDLGLAFVFAPAPVDPELAGALDAAPTLESASATGGARAWRLAQQSSTPHVGPPDHPWLRPFLLVLQGCAVVVVIVLAAPTRRRV